MNYKEKIEELDAIINLYKDDPADGLRNKIWAWHTRLLEQAQRDAVEGFVEWLEGQTIELREVNFGYACNKVNILAETYLKEQEEGGE